MHRALVFLLLLAVAVYGLPATFDGPKRVSNVQEKGDEEEEGLVSRLSHVSHVTSEEGEVAEAEKETCPICWKVFDEEDAKPSFPFLCKTIPHKFHAACIEKFRQKNQATNVKCPLCRAEPKDVPSQQQQQQLQHQQQQQQQESAVSRNQVEVDYTPSIFPGQGNVPRAFMERNQERSFYPHFWFHY